MVGLGFKVAFRASGQYWYHNRNFDEVLAEEKLVYTGKKYNKLLD